MGIGGQPQGVGKSQTLQAMMQVGKDTAEEIKSEQKAAAQAAQASNTQTVYRSKVPKKPKKLKAHSKRIKEMMKMGEQKERLLPVEQIKDQAQKFQDRNPELKKESLQQLREMIKPGDTKEDILRKLNDFYSDPSLADEALEFLLETTEGELYQEVLEAKEEFNEENEREITAGRNITEQAREASDKGLGTPTSLRDMYRDITGNPRESTTLFNELSDKYEFKELQKVVDFLLHSMGADMKAKGPSIPRGELHRLMTETRSLQAILGVYRFFKGRMGLVGKMFKQSGLTLPKQLTFESLSKAFMSLAGERYPSPDKVLGQAKRLGIDDWIQAKIIALSQLRDSIRELAMNQIFRSLQHRDELYMAIIEALEDLEDELEELLEQQEEEDEEEDEEWEEEEEEEEF